MGTGTVYLTALSFGYGPASHAVAVARALRARDPRLFLVAAGDTIAFEFMAASGAFDRVVSTGVDAWALPTSSANDDVVVSIADFARALEARATVARVVLVDALYWMWSEDPIDPGAVDRYLCLAFPGVEERLARHSSGGAAMRVIPQIVATDLPAPSRERSGVVMNLGGAMSPLGGNHRFLAALLHVAVRAVTESLGTVDIVAACSAPAAAAIRTFGDPSPVRLGPVDFDDMMTALAERSVLLTVPGLSIVWEALAAEIPTVVLPGSNYSQHQQVVAYERFVDAAPILTWNDVPGYGLLPGGLPEAEGVTRAIELGERFSSDAAAQEALRVRLVELLRGGRIGPPVLRPGHPWSSLDGADAVAQEVFDLVAGRVSAS
jgi:hypothetical protein